MDEAVRAVEVQLGIHVGFLDRLLHEDDWSFVVKAHALIEAAVSFLVTRALNEPALSDVISRLRLNDDRTGKMAFVKRLNLLDQRHIRFIRRLSEMRNAFSHSIENVDNTIDAFLRSIDDEKRHSYLGAFSAMINDQALIATHSVKAIDFARENPRLAIWLGTLDTVAWVYLQIQEIDLASEERVSGEAARDILRLIAAGELVRPSLLHDPPPEPHPPRGSPVPDG